MFRIATVRQLALSLFVMVALGATPAYSATVCGTVFDTLRGTLITNARIVLNTTPARETRTDAEGQYTFKDLKPGTYLVRIVRPDEPDVVGRIWVSDRQSKSIINLDLSKILAPDGDDAY